MAREFSVVVSINAAGAIAGGRQFKAGADQVNRSNRSMQRSTATSTRRFTSMITVMGRFRGVASLMFAGFLGVGGISAVVRTLSQFETKMSAVNALLGDRGSTQIMRILTDRARELGATTAFTAAQAAEGMKFLTLAGFDALEVFQAIGPALTLAQAGALGLGEAADIVSNVMAAFSIEAGKVIHVVDALAFVSARSNTNIQQLGQAMKFVAPVAGALGVSVTDTAVALGILGNAGLQASLAGTSLRRVMSGLLNPSKEATAVLAQMGLTSQELVGFLDKEDGLVLIVEALARAGLDAADAFTLFGQRGAPGVLALKAQRVELRRLTEATREAEGAASQMAETMIDNLGGDAKIAISALAEGILQMGDAGLLDFLRESTQGFTGFIRGLTGMTAGLAGMSEVMQAGVANGEALKAQFDNIKKAAIVLAVVLSRGLIGSLLAGALAAFRFARLVARSIAVLWAFRSGALALTIALQGLKAAFLSSPLGIALLIGSLAAYILTGDDAAEISRKQAEGLLKIVEAGDDAALTFDKVAEAQKKFKKVQIVDAILAQQNILIAARKALEDFGDANSGLAKAQAAADMAQRAFNQGVDDGLGKGAIRKLSGEFNIARHRLAELNETMGDTTFIELEAAVEKARIKFFDLMKTATSMDEVLAGNKQFIDAVAEAAAQAAKDVAEFEKNFMSITGVTVDWNIALKKTVDGLLPMVAAQEKAKKALKDIRLALEKTNVQLIKMGQNRADLTRAEKEAEFQLKNSLRAQTALEKAIKTQVEITEDLADKVADLKGETGGLAALNRDYRRSVLAARDAVANSSLTLDEYRERVRLLREELGLAKIALEETCDKTDELRECMSENAKAMESIWDQAMRNIQDSFADAFRNIGSGFDDFAKGILDAFKDLLANMAAQAAINNIFGGGGGFFNDFFGGLAGGGGSRGGSSAGSVVGGLVRGGGSSSGGTGPLSGITSGIQGAFESFAAGATTFFAGAANFFQVNGTINGLALVQGGTGLGGIGTGSAAITAEAGGLAGAGAVAAGAGIGALSGAVADAILGGRGDPIRNAIFSAIGGAIGSIWGPIGSVIGGAIGSFVDNLFGGAKKLERATIELSVSGDEIFAIQSQIVSKQRSFFRGRSFTETRKNIDSQFFSIEQTFAAFAAAMNKLATDFGGTTDFLDNFNFDIDIDVTGAAAEMNIRNAIDSLFQAVTDAFLDDVEGLPARIQATLERFSNNLESFITAIELVSAIENLFNIDLIESTAEAIAAANVGIIESYENALVGYRAVIDEYDGSLDSLRLLTEATAIFTQIQLDLISVYQLLGQEVSALFQSSAQTIREALMSEEELFNFRRTLIDELVEQASMTTDPEELSALAAEINRLGLENFNSLDEDQRALLGPEFIEFFEGLDELFGNQIADGISSVVQDQADLDLEVATRMTEAANAIIAAARALELEAERRAEEFAFRNELQL